MKKALLTLTGLFVLATSVPALAHFQMVYTPESALEKAETIDMKLVFTHPFEAGHTMDMGTPEAFFVVRKGKKKDLLNTLKPITWKSLSNSGKAYETSYKLRGMGDNVFCLIPSPYFEGEEDAYIQQITKAYVNTGGFPTDWDAEIGLPAEIVPLDKPYGLWTGNVFRGVVKGNGKPVPFAEIEVEYMNHKPNMKKNAFAKKAAVEAPQDCFVTMTIKANKDGEFAFGIPKAGWWGFCALGAGPANTYKGKELSQDAVIWVQAHDMK
ncbi:MAG: nickel transporter [Deltaproteobacteria bacterium]|nr:MAG: nickel transporter [Deltaproteobacteria bacterium]